MLEATNNGSSSLRCEGLSLETSQLNLHVEEAETKHATLKSALSRYRQESTKRITAIKKECDDKITFLLSQLRDAERREGEWRAGLGGGIESSTVPSRAVDHGLQSAHDQPLHSERRPDTAGTSLAHIQQEKRVSIPYFELREVQNHIVTPVIELR